ncbi:MAG: hypothetical protein R3234_07725 [Thermoanaerobaculia bacterium]|nr:hypothetical protein [Thermoanaerobaculia bacterium]
MHPALIPIVLVAFLPLAWRRGPWTRALAVVATAVSVRMAPSVVAPTVVPSPSAILGEAVPWQETLDPSRGNPHLVDITHQVEPWLLFLRDEYRRGRLPFWNPFQFSGEPFWSNGQSAPLFPLHLLFAGLPLVLGFTLLPWIRLVAGGMGAWALARELGVSERGAWLAGVVYPLSGMIVSWVLYPMGNAHPLVPWVFWALERFLRGRSSWRPLAGLWGLQLLAGHPETPVFTALLAGIYLLARGRDVAGSVRSWTGLAGTWLVGLAISAVQIVPLAHTVLASSKWQEHALPGPVPLDTKLALLSRFLLPDLFGRAGDGTWWGPFNDPATSVYAGALVLPLAVLGLVRIRRDPRWRATAVMGVFALLSAYHLLGTGWILPRLPIVGRGLHHYLKFGVELALALFAAAGLDRVVRDRMVRLPWLLVAAVAAWAGSLWWIFRDDWSRNGLSASATGGLVWAVAAGGLVALLARSAPSGLLRRYGAPLVVAITVLDLSQAHDPAVPELPIEDLHPRTPAVEALQELTSSGGRVAGLGSAFRPNAAMVFRVRDVRGDSPLKLRHYDRVYGEISRTHPWLFQPILRWDHPLLDRLGVRWVLGGPDQQPPGSDWNPVYEGADARIWERPGGAPLVRWARVGGDRDPRRLRVVERLPGSWELEIGPGPPRRLVVAETRDHGWRARWNGGVLEIQDREGPSFSVAVPRGGGRLRLRYRPRGIVWGGALSLAGLLALPPWGRGLFRRRRSGDRVEAP